MRRARGEDVLGSGHPPPAPFFLGKLQLIKFPFKIIENMFKSNHLKIGIGPPPPLKKKKELDPLMKLPLHYDNCIFTHFLHNRC